MWSGLEGNPGGGTTVASSASAVASMDPASLLNTQLASALSMTGDAQYWEETISPATIRSELSSADPSSPTSTPVILKGMKWLLASISKGRNVSDFYPHVVKLVGAVSLEVRKMVYMYLVQYANHDATTRELSLLSINSFQRGLADAEQWIRALALRVLTSIQIPDILQIQILGVQKCSADKSPYVRKCAANALAKLFTRCVKENSDDVEAATQQQQILLDICQDLLHHDQATMVLTSALIAWQELCPQRLDMLHACFRKFCHLLTDMDEWGQVVVIDTFARYCRTYFAEPAGFRNGSAEQIDRERRVRRTIFGLESEQPVAASQSQQSSSITNNSATAATHNNNNNNTLTPSLADQAALAGVALPQRTAAPSKIKRRVVKKGFYSDEEDESTDEEVYAETTNGPALPVASAMRQRNVMGFSDNTNPKEHSPFVPAALAKNNNNNTISGGFKDNISGTPENTPTNSLLQQHHQQNPLDTEDSDLAEDHRMFLNAAMHLLKSRNAGVVLAVCSLQYYCGVSSIHVRASMGKALVRIHRDRREIQYVVLASIRTLASESPSAFAPFLHDFFVKALDPPFTRTIKLDILTSLALEAVSIDAVLKELRTYVQHGNAAFAAAAIRALGRVVELARIVYDRHAAKTDTEQRSKANQIALNALHGLLTLTQVSEKESVVGEAVIVMRLILQILQYDASGDKAVSDPHRVQERSIQRMLLLTMKTLVTRMASSDDEVDDDEDSDDENEEAEKLKALHNMAKVSLPPNASAAAIWTLGEHLSSLDALGSSLNPFRDEASQSRIRLEVSRMLVKAFPDLTPLEKEQGIHLASKLIISRVTGGSQSIAANEGPLCEQLLAMGRVEMNPDVRDRARFESSLLRAVSALQHDFDALEDVPLGMDKALTKNNVKKILLFKKPACSSLPVENHSNTHAVESSGFRWGTLSSLVGHQARSAYIPLPPWAKKDSPSSLRAPAEKKPQIAPSSGQLDIQAATSKPGGFYQDDSSSTDDSSSSESSDDDSSSSSSSSDDDSSSSDDSSILGQPNPTGPAGTGNLLGMPTQPTPTMPAAPATAPMPAKVQTVQDDCDSSDESSSSSDSSDDVDDSSSDGDHPAMPSAPSSTLIPNLMNQNPTSGAGMDIMGSSVAMQKGSTSTASDDMKGLVLAPVVTEGASALSTSPDMERDSGDWMQLVRPEHSGGLSVLARYIHGSTKVREAQLLGVSNADKNAAIVFLQLRLEAQASISSVFRRVKVLQRPVSGSTIGPKKVYLPPEIDQLKAGQQADCILGMEFASTSDRDGNLLAKFDFKFGAGGIPIEIKPSLGQLLLPCHRTVSQFDNELKRLQGFQRVESTLSLPLTPQTLNNTIFAAARLSLVEQGWSNNMLRLVGTLPASHDPVYVLVQQPTDGSYKFIVCSDNALAANSLMNVLKKKIAST